MQLGLTRWGAERDGINRLTALGRLLLAPLAILAFFMSAALVLGQATNRPPVYNSVFELRSDSLVLDSGLDGYVDSVKRFVIGSREFVVVTFWARWGASPPEFVWSATVPAAVTVSTYERSDLSSIEGAMAATVTASTPFPSSEGGRLCFGIESAGTTYFVSGFENCWSFK